MDVMELIDDIIDPKQNNSPCVINSKGDLVPLHDIRPQVEPYDQEIGNFVIESLSLGESIQEVSKKVKGGIMTVMNWRKTIPEFNAAIKEAQSFRNDVLLDKSYREDVLASYHEDDIDAAEAHARLNYRSKRRKMVGEHVKVTEPDKFKPQQMNLTNQTMGLTINLPEGSDIDLTKFQPSLAANGNLEVEGCQKKSDVVLPQKPQHP